MGGMVDLFSIFYLQTIVSSLLRVILAVWRHWFHLRYLLMGLHNEALQDTYCGMPTEVGRSQSSAFIS
jgi:hypothetical protein